MLFKFLEKHLPHHYFDWHEFAAAGPGTVSAHMVASFGANALIGGSESNFVLQPVSAEAGAGVNVAIGVTALKISRVD